MRVIYHNWSAAKQRPHPQSVAEISRHSVFTTETKKEYRKLNNELRRETEKAKARWREDQCDEMEQFTITTGR